MKTILLPRAQILVLSTLHTREKFTYPLFFRKWLTNPVRKLSTNKIEKGTATILESQGADILERQIAGRLGAIKVGNHGYLRNNVLFQEYCCDSVFITVASDILTVFYQKTSFDCKAGLSQLHSPSMFAVKAKIYRVLYNQASSIALDETSSYWSTRKST